MYPIIKVPEDLRHNKISNIFLNYSIKPVEHETNKGTMEPAFSIILNRNFKGLIFQDRIIDYYRPDFLYFNKKHNLYIDIEIDEPYEGKTKVPIHYIGSDESRDNFFLGKGWFIIRFTEKQIVEHFQECCNELKKLVNSRFKNSHKYSGYKSFVPKEPRWTKEMALRMAKEDYRYSYLSPENNLLIKYILKEAV